MAKGDLAMPHLTPDPDMHFLAFTRDELAKILGDKLSAPFPHEKADIIIAELEKLNA